MFKNKACMYLRLSKDDGIHSESNSITNQRELIQSYARKNELEIVKEYTDDGYSGTNYDRPALKNMLEEISKNDRAFDVIIVKDLSRFGRDYIGAGKYIQKIFPQFHIRFISINDNYDSQHADMSDTNLILPIRNFINDSYARDISNKVKSSQKMKREKGEYIGSFAPYGYKKSEENKNKLIVDENVRDIIKSIFDMKLKGYSSKSIAEELNDLGIDSPKVYKEKQGLHYTGGFKVLKVRNWSAKSINRIIENEVYIGTMLQGKSATINYKNKKQIEKDKRDWVKVEHTHEGIISKEVFYIANRMLKRDLYSSKEKKTDLFSGMLFCKDCNSPLVRRVVKYKEKEQVFYICSKYNKEKSCTRHSMKKEDLEEILTGIFEDYLVFHENLYQKIQTIDITKNIVDTQIGILQREKEMTQELLSSLYVDLEEDIISKEEYQIFRKNYLEQITKLNENIEYRRKKQETAKERIKNNEKWLIDIKKYKALTKPDRLSVVMLIDKILIGEDKEIEVIFNHQEEVAFLEAMANSREEKTVRKFVESEVCYG
ncbi:TPA: recombinase family protein [Streptococcus pyogenes]|nr:recombinase family protein [Streptococcus pyogenes]HES6895214.1 recombinase family protein [Streptococcus pyogenes]HES7591575.1 recombinase family protein [Streptococcus pyogenes]